MEASCAKSEFLHRESHTWEQLRESNAELTRVQGQLAEKSAEAGDLSVRCSDWTAAAAEAREHAVQLSRRVQQLEGDLGRTVGERDSLRTKAAQEAEKARDLEQRLEEARKVAVVLCAQVAEEVSKARALSADGSRPGRRPRPPLLTLRSGRGP